MNFKYSHLTPPYCGQKNTSNLQTLNSSLLEKAWTKIENGQIVELFPQRVPRIGFYEEIEEQETFEFKIKSKEFRQKISNKIKESINNEEELLTLCEFGIRIGITDCILQLNNKKNARLEVLKDIARTRKAINEDKEQNCNELLFYLKNNKLSLEDSALISNRILVKNYRYANKKILDEEQKLVKIILQEIDEGKQQNLKQKFRIAALTRGVAMSKTITTENAIKLIDKGIESIKRAETTDDYERLIKKELLLTTLLTRAKTLKSTNKNEESYHQILELKNLDPMDSTTWSEAGLEQYKRGLLVNAKESFEMAFKLGPPAMALNAFYAGLTCKELDNNIEALRWFKKSSECDQSAISPKIEEANLLKKMNQINEAKIIAKEVLQNKDFKELMSSEEKLCLENI